MRRGTAAVVAGLGLAVLAMTTGCSALADDEVRPELGADARGGAREGLHRVIDWPGTDAVRRLDAAWSDSCGNATSPGFFQPADGTSCRVDGGALYAVDGADGVDGADAIADAVRIVGPALREGGLTDQDLAAQTIDPDGTVPKLVDDGGHRSVELGDGLGQDRFAVVEVAGWDGSLGLGVDAERSVVRSARGLGDSARVAAARATGAATVLVVTHSASYFTSYDNVPPTEAPRSTVPPCYSGSNDCVGG
jgi:hypothetical protein